MMNAAVCEQPSTSGVPSVVRDIRRTGRIDWPALRRCLQDASGNDIVEVLGWTVNYYDGELGMVCRVVPLRSPGPGSRSWSSASSPSPKGSRSAPPLSI